jgi:hypothetical protein
MAELGPSSHPAWQARPEAGLGAAGRRTARGGGAIEEEQLGRQRRGAMGEVQRAGGRGGQGELDHAGREGAEPSAVAS